MGNKFTYGQKVEDQAVAISDKTDYTSVDDHFRQVLKQLKPT